MLAITRRRQSTSFMLWAWTRSSRRSRTRHGRVVPPAPRGRIPSHLSPRDRMRRKLQTRRGRQRYALRMQTVEPVFGQIKQGRGFRQFLLRGLEKVNRRMVADLHRPTTCSNCSALGSVCTGKHGTMGQPNASGTFAEVVSTALFAKLSGGRAGATGKISCRDPCR